MNQQAPPPGHPPAGPPPAYAPGAPPGYGPSPAPGLTRLSAPAIAGLVAAALILLGGAAVLTAALVSGVRGTPRAPERADPTPGLLAPSPIAVDAGTDATAETPTADPAPDIVAEVSLGGGAVVVPVPENWSYEQRGRRAVVMSDNRGNLAYLTVRSGDPAADPGAAVAQEAGSFLDPEGYSQLEVTDPELLDPTGSVTGMARIEYRGVWSDTQFTDEVAGVAWALVRQDGTILFALVENSPPEALDGNSDSWIPVMDGAFANFSGG